MSKSLFPTENQKIISASFLIFLTALIFSVPASAQSVFNPIRINFQPASSLIPDGYLPDAGDLLASRNGYTYGWNKLHTDVTRERALHSDQRLDTICHFHAGGIWEITIPDNTYKVTVSVGDAGFSCTNTVNVEGTNFWTNITTAPNQFLQATKNITVTDGRLTMDAGNAPEKSTRLNFIIVEPLPTENQPPQVEAGQDQLITLPLNTVNLQALVTDDGLPAPPALATIWEKVSGPGNVSFTNPGMMTTAATFSTAGLYVLKLTAHDGEYSAFDTVNITVKLALESISINFQPKASVIPAGYLPDYGDIKGSRNGYVYGWLTDHTTFTRERNNNSDQRLDTICHFRYGGAWELDLPNGIYNVTISIGDAGFQSWHTLIVEGVVYWDKVFLLGNQFRENTSQLTVNDGKLTLSCGDSVEKETRINYIIITPALDVNHPPVVDAGANQTLLFSPAAGFVSALLDGTVTDDGKPPAGKLSTLWSKVDGPGTVTFDDTQATDTRARFSAAGLYVLKLTASDGEIPVADTLNVTVNAPNQDLAVNINFQPENAVIPAGYLPDCGKIFSTQGSFSFGWNTNHLDAVRDRNSNPDQKLDTLCHIHAGGVWEIQLPNGEYDATVSVGDALFGSIHTINVEGINFWTAAGLAANQFAQKTQTVRVSDGRLTMNAGNSANLSTRVNYINLKSKFTSTNTPPQVAAGRDKIITLPNNTLNLDGTVTDDGLPAGSTLSLGWSKFSGTGTVTFVNTNTIDTTATFSQAGTYVLKLSAGDGALTSSANITIIVNPKPALPGIPIPQTKLQATASSSRHYNEPPFAIDNKPATYWLSSRYSTSQPTAYITFSLGQKYKVTGLDYLPSPLTDELGTRSLILSHKIYTSLDGTTFQQAASGNWAADKTKKQTAITATEATHIRLEALPPTSANLPSYDPRADYYAAAAEINIYYLSENQPPKITAGPDLDVILPATAHLDAVVTDDGLPQNSAVTVQWAVLSGPGTVTFTNPYAIDTQAAFSATGAYYLQFTASDTDLTISDTIKVNVYPTGYQYPPDVNAGEDIALYLPDTLVQMKGLVSDDGLPNGTLTATWSQQSGPAQAVIAQPGQPDTQVSFPQTGVYVLRLTAFDGGKYGYDEININVLPRQAFSLAFDFGTYNSPVHPDTIRITQNTTYAPGGYGWLDTYKHQAIDRANGNNLERDFISDTLKGTFKVDLLNGTYNITVISGDSLYAHDELMVKANGLPVAEHITSQPMQWQEAGFSVVVDEGTLVLEFSDEGGNNNLWVVNGILISLKDSFNKANIIEKMKLVNDAWITLNPDSGDNNWGRATYFEGNMAMYRIYPNQTYYDYALSWANKHNWTLKDGATTRIAEYQAAGKVYIELYEYEPDPKKISMITSSIQNMVNSTRVDDWWWADALHMAMPAFAELGALYKNPAYTEKMYALYNHTKTLRMGRGLYNTTDKLWWRDASFLPPYTAPNGQDCFWSRGNGWVIAAHAKMLDIMTSNQSTTQDAHYAEYVQCLKDMAAALKAVQRDDGFWNVSLHDPDHFGGPEASGTAFFTYALAWGINSGNLNRADYLSTVTKAWNALANLAVHPDGRLGYVQGVGMDPSSAQPVTYNSTSDFGVGAFLLAGSEVYKLAPDPID